MSDPLSSRVKKKLIPATISSVKKHPQNIPKETNSKIYFLRIPTPHTYLGPLVPLCTLRNCSHTEDHLATKIHRQHSVTRLRPFTPPPAACDVCVWCSQGAQQQQKDALAQSLPIILTPRPWSFRVEDPVPALCPGLLDPLLLPNHVAVRGTKDQKHPHHRVDGDDRNLHHASDRR